MLLKTSQPPQDHILNQKLNQNPQQAPAGAHPGMHARETPGL